MSIGTQQTSQMTARVGSRRLVTVVLVCMVLALAVAFRGGAPAASSGRALIVAADDAGMCESANQGTIRGLVQGVVTSASIMTCCPGFEEFSQFATSHPEFDYGVHLTLTCDLREQPWGPVFDAAEVPSLIDEQGHFWAWPADVAKHAQIGDVEKELRAQIRRAIAAGIRVSHLDHHMWVLFARPDLLRLYVQLGREFDLPVRFSRTVPERILKAYGPEMIAEYRRQIEALETHGLPVLDFIESENYSIAPELKRGFHLNTLRELPNGTSEIVIHCASRSAAGAAPPHVDQRVADTDFFASSESREELARLRVELIDWKRLRNPR